MTPHKAAQGGMALIEALVSSAVLGVEIIGPLKIKKKSLQTATDTRQRITAHGLALDAMDCHQSQRLDCPINDQTAIQGHAYTRKIALNPSAGPGLVDITVTVHWQSAARTGTTGNDSTLVLRSSRASVPIWVGVSLP